MSERQQKIEQAARVLHRFLWYEKESTDPPGGARSRDCVSCVGIDDYEREEELILALGEALGIDPDAIAPEDESKPMTIEDEGNMEC